MRGIIAAGVALILAGCGEPVTKGDVKDMNTAIEVERCARQYLGKPSNGPDTEIWITCLHASSELARRDKIKVARRILKKKGNVFEGTMHDLSNDFIARIKRGD